MAPPRDALPPLPSSLDPRTLAHVLPGFAHWFRYPLHRRDFHPLRTGDDPAARLLGYYAAKPLYGKLDAHGHVDRSGGLDGGIVVVFVPSPARSWRRARLIRTRIARSRVRRADGKRSWPAILDAAEAAIRSSL